MRKISYSLLTLFIFLVSFTSCRRVVDAIFNGVDFTAPDVIIPVPVVPFVLPGELQLGTFYQKLNLDSAIKANTAGAFGVGVLRSVKIKQITVTILNADDNNNLSNFQTARVTLSSNSNQSTINILNVDFPTTAQSSFVITPTDSPELLSYLKGGELTYQVFGKSRKTTSKELTMVVSVVVTAK